MVEFTIVIHGGAGDIGYNTDVSGKKVLPEHQGVITKTLISVYRTVFTAAQKGIPKINDVSEVTSGRVSGEDSFSNNPDQLMLSSRCQSAETALDLAVFACQLLEDSMVFNAGRGACLTREPHQQVREAAVMCGSTYGCGGAGLLRRCMNPSSLVLKILRRSCHVMLMGGEAEAFGEEHGERLMSDKEVTEAEDLAIAKYNKAKLSNSTDALDCGFNQGETVGCVIMYDGHVAACTSTGGRTGKYHGRIGDSCNIGQGTYANNFTAAVSCTGYGEAFQRRAIAYDIHARLKYSISARETFKERYPHTCSTIKDSATKPSLSVQEAVDLSIGELFPGTGGCIAVNSEGKIGIAFNTKAMFRVYGNSTMNDCMLGIWEAVESYPL